MDAILPAAKPLLSEGPLSKALEEARSRFMARNLGRCAYLAVQFETDRSGRRLTVVANYTSSRNDRRWQRAEALLPDLEPLDADEAIERIEAAFAQLDAGIDAARIARLFAPHSAAHRMRQTAGW
jgi:hypothetical protein